VSISWRCRDFSQALIFTDEVIQYVTAYQQNSTCATESGGQLFGTVTEELVTIVAAAGPYTNDERGRYHYRSNPHGATKAIETHEAAGLTYLGEWHTHAECRPRPSSIDIETMLTLVQRSTLRASAAMLLIIGCCPPPAGMFAATFEKGRFHRWLPEKPASVHGRILRWIAGALT
jgi:integrative and conjugative element protein (TIGR02256 family)